jgi:hypothetical protein
MVLVEMGGPSGFGSTLRSTVCPPSRNVAVHLGPANDVVMAYFLTTGPVVQPLVIRRREFTHGINASLSAILLVLSFDSKHRLVALLQEVCWVVFQ